MTAKNNESLFWEASPCAGLSGLPSYCKFLCKVKEAQLPAFEFDVKRKCFFQNSNGHLLITLEKRTVVSNSKRFFQLEIHSGQKSMMQLSRFFSDMFFFYSFWENVKMTMQKQVLKPQNMIFKLCLEEQRESWKIIATIITAQFDSFSKSYGSQYAPVRQHCKYVTILLHKVCHTK